MQNVFKKSGELLNKIPLFKNDSILYLVWNIFLFSILMFILLEIPVDICFEIDNSRERQPIWFILRNLAIWSLLCDTLYTLNTPYYSRGVFIKERLSIIKHYIHRDFLLDLFIICPMTFIVYKISDDIIFKMNFLLILYKIKKIDAKIEDYFQFEDKKQGLFNLLKLMMQILIVAHYFGCFWNYLAQWEINNFNITNTWLHALEIQNEQWEIKYINSLYYSIVTMVTVGYGDISPHNTIEKGFSIVIIMVACGFFAYALNSVGQILKEMYRVEDEFK